MSRRVEIITSIQLIKDVVFRPLYQQVQVELKLRVLMNFNLFVVLIPLTY